MTQVVHWQPFSTAPKDGTEILGYRDNGLDENNFLIMAYDKTYNQWWANGEGHLDADEMPTHWMPLPAPPNKADILQPEGNTDG